MKNQAAIDRPDGLLLTLSRFMSPARRRQALILLLLMPLAAVAEMASVASVIPLIAAITSNGAATNLPWIAEITGTIARRFGVSLTLVAGGIFICAAMSAAAIRLLLAWSSQSFAYGLGHDISVEIQRRVLYQPYLYHVENNSSRVLASLEKVEQLVFNLLMPLLQGAAAAIIALFIASALILVDPRSTIVALASVSAIYGITLLATRNRLAQSSTVIGQAYDKRIQAIQENLGGIRDILVDHSQPIYAEAFRAIDERLMRARMQSAILGIAPRFIIEAVGLAIFALLAISLASSAGGLLTTLPVLGALALGAQRSLPLIQQIYRGWASLTSSRTIVEQLMVLTRLPVDRDDERPLLPFRSEIRFENVDFGYGGRSRLALRDINLVFRRGSRTALIGRTGSGKTTLTDLVMGLIEPSAGRILIDGVELNRKTAGRWHRNVAHVPQSIFLSDASIARNIALAMTDEELDIVRVRGAADTAQLSNFIADLPDGLDTMVGERGVRLSGGQRQRLGLARAIYKGAPVLLLDEATSALDDVTESAVLQALDSLGEAGCTIIIVAHRASTIATCDAVVQIEGGRLVDPAVS